MALCAALPQLSIIVPVLDESPVLPGLFATLAAQQQIRFELVVCDGGSGDGSFRWLQRQRDAWPFPVVLRQTAAGRARQLNAGAAVARAPFLLFLHVDSRFADPLALSSGLSVLREALRRSETPCLAGHFALRFDLRPAERGAGYYFFEAKARSGRPGTIHGDQGFLLSRVFFDQLGPFDQPFGLFEDDRFAERVFAVGRWLLLPVAIQTSARRFRREGLRSRQMLNALLVAFAAIGWDGFFHRAPAIYRRQDHSRPLELFPYFSLIAVLLRQTGWTERCRFWLAIGRFVRSQLWQLGLALDCRRNRHRGLAPGEGPTPWLRRCERWLIPLTGHAAGTLAAAFGVRLWFGWMWWRLRRRAHRRPPERPS